MKVNELYKDTLDLEELELQSGRSDYHQKSYDFVAQVWGVDVKELSKKQINWLEKISEDLMEAMS